MGESVANTNAGNNTASIPTKDHNRHFMIHLPFLSTGLRYIPKVLTSAYGHSAPNAIQLWEGRGIYGFFLSALYLEVLLALKKAHPQRRWTTGAGRRTDSICCGSSYQNRYAGCTHQIHLSSSERLGGVPGGWSQSKMLDLFCGYDRSIPDHRQNIYGHASCYMTQRNSQ